MGTEIVPVNKSELPTRRDIENKSQGWRPSQSLSRFVADSIEGYRIKRGQKSSRERLSQTNSSQRDSESIASTGNATQDLPTSRVEQSGQLDLEPKELGFIPLSTENGIPEPVESFSSQPLGVPIRDSLQGSIYDDSQSHWQERSFDGMGGLEALSVKWDNPESLVDSLASNFPEELTDPLKGRDFEVELVSKGESFTITPLEVEPLSFEDAIEAPLDVKVSLLVKGAAMLEKHKHTPPPLTRRETQAIDEKKGLILKAIDDIVEQGTERAGKLIADKWGRRGLSFVGATGLALSATACASEPQETAVSPFPIEPVASEITPALAPPNPTPEIANQPTEVWSGFTAPINPPEFVPEAAGGEFPEGVHEVAEIDKYRALLTLSRQEGETFLAATDEEYKSILDMYAQNNSLEVKQVWNGEFGDLYQMASVIEETAINGDKAVYWFSTEGGALSARPDIPSTLEGSFLAELNLPSGTHPEWRWGGDGNIYMYMIDDQSGEDTAWFNTTIAAALAEGGLEQAWELTVQPFRIENEVPQELVDGQWNEISVPEIPENLQHDVVLSENGKPRLQVKLNDYVTKREGLIMAEYSSGEWKPVPFSFVRSPELTLEVLKLPSAYSYEQEILNLTSKYINFVYPVQFQGMRLEVDESTNETQLTMLLISRGRAIKIIAGSISTPSSTNNTEQEGYLGSSLTVSEIADVLGAAEDHIPYEKVAFIAVVTVLTDQSTDEYCAGWDKYIPGFEDFCFENAGNEERLIRTPEGFRFLVRQASLPLTPELVQAGIDWWDDDLIEPISRQEHQVYASAYFEPFQDN